MNPCNLDAIKSDNDKVAFIDEDIGDLPHIKLVDKDGKLRYRTLWKPSENEEESLKKGGYIVLDLFSNFIPPVGIGVSDPEDYNRFKNDLDVCHHPMDNGT